MPGGPGGPGGPGTPNPRSPYNKSKKKIKRGFSLASPKNVISNKFKMATILEFNFYVTTLTQNVK